MKLPIGQSYVETFDYCWRERGAAVRFGIVPFIVVLVLSIVLQAFGFDQTAAQGQAPPTKGASATLAITSVIQAIIYMPMAVSWYRLVVYGREEAGRRPVFTFGRLEWRMLWWQVLAIGAAALAMTLGAVICGALYFIVGDIAGKAAGIIAAGIVGFVILVAVLMSMVRLGLAFVLIATDEPGILKAAWRMTHGIAARLFGIVVLISLTGMLLIAILRLFALLIGMIAAMAFNSTVTAIVPYLEIAGQCAADVVIFLGIATLFGQLYLKLQQMPKAAPEAVPPMPVDEY